MLHARAGRAQVIVLPLLLAGLACAGESGSSSFRVDPLRLDDTGQALRVQGRPERIVSLIPAVTEILFAIGAGPDVVARTDYCNYPPEARRLPSVGDGIRPAVEPILAFRPDLVVIFAGPDNAPSIERLRALGVPVFALYHNSLADLYRNIRRLAHVTGRREMGDSLVGVVRTMLDSIRASTAGRPPVRVYYDLWGDPPHTIGRGSYLNDLIGIAGGANVFGQLAEPSPRISLEAIIAADPEVVLIASDSPRGDPAARLKARAGWSAIRAVREGRVAALDADLVHRLGPRVPEAARALAVALAEARAKSGRGTARE